MLLRSKSVPTITSSITYRGPLFPLIELIPLIDIVALEPGSPLLLITLTPAALPWSILETLDAGWFVSSSAEICDIEDTNSLLSVEPYPVKTTSSRADLDATRETWILSELLTDIVCDVNPMNEISRIESSSEISNEKLPSKSDVVPLDVPDSIIDAPGRGIPFESVIFPVTVAWISSCNESTVKLFDVFFSWRIILSATIS